MNKKPKSKKEKTEIFEAGGSIIDKLITNNPLVAQRFAANFDIEFYHGASYHRILIITRDMIHKGAKLCTHPLSSSLKPNETPYKSIIVSGDIGKIDMQSIIIIEESIATSQKFPELNRSLPQNILNDFMEVDSSLIAKGKF
ncbi:MAG: GrdX family protein [Defluviitaleaceae bacterium]|nr:GrdX family protein [Defluviitaleaceae bacterium]